MNKLFPKGHRVKNLDKLIFPLLVFVVAFPFSLLAGGIGLLLYHKFYGQWFIVGGVSAVYLLISSFLIYRIYQRFITKGRWFTKRRREFILWRFMIQNGFYYTKRVKGNSNGSREKIKLPKVYLKQDKLTMSASFQLEGIKFQDRFLKIGNQLETAFSADMMNQINEGAYITFEYAIDAIRSRISAKDVRGTVKDGIKLAEGVTWNFIEDPHLLIAGGTGGGKTVLMRSLLVGLLRIGRVEILDPKEADFVKLADLEVLRDRVTWTTETMAQRVMDAHERMRARYAIMRERSNEKNETELGAFYKYDLEPDFILIDEFPSWVTELENLPRDSKIDAFKVMGDLKQIFLKGRQAGVFVIISTQNVKTDDLPSTLKDNIMFRITVGRVSGYTYQSVFGEVNENKAFKYVEKVHGKRVYGRGYVAVNGLPAKEFFAPLLPNPKNYNFYDDFKQLPRIEDIKQPVVAEVRYLQNDLIDELSTDERMFKKIKGLLKDSGVDFTGKDFSEKEKRLFVEVFDRKNNEEGTLKEIIAEVVLDFG